MQLPHERLPKRKQPEPAVSSSRADESANLNPTVTQKDSPPSLYHSLEDDEWESIYKMLVRNRGKELFNHGKKETRDFINAGLYHLHNLQSNPHFTPKDTAQKLGIHVKRFEGRYKNWEELGLWKKILKELSTRAQDHKIEEQPRKQQTKNKQHTQPPLLPPLPLVQHPLEQSPPGTQDKQFYRDIEQQHLRKRIRPPALPFEIICSLPDELELDLSTPLLSVQPSDPSLQVHPPQLNQPIGYYSSPAAMFRQSHRMPQPEDFLLEQDLRK